LYRDRRDAGVQLAERLASVQLHQPVVLAVPRGGVEVGREVARALGAELDLALVRKLRHPMQPELAIGAVGEGGTVVIDDRTAAGVDRDALQREIETRQGELGERSDLYRQAKSSVDIADRDALLVDDGVATGSTMQAAVEVTRRRGARRVIVALPVAPPQAVDRLKESADEVVCLMAPSDFAAVGQFYQQFDQVDDDEVVQTLRET